MPDAEQFALPMAGQCRCGRIRYKVTKPPSFIIACHCTDCQQLTSSAFSTGMAVPQDGFTLQGEPDCWERTADSGGWSRQFTCPACKGWTHTRTQNAPRMVVVRPSTLIDHSWVRPIAQIFTRSALPWALLQTSLSFEKEFEDPQQLEQAFAASGIAPGNVSDAVSGTAQAYQAAANPDIPKGGAPAPGAIRKDKVKAKPEEREAGRFATAPHEIPLQGWWHVAKRASAGFMQDRVMAEAASVTFYALLALFPAIAALISIYGIFLDPANVGQQLAHLASFVPSSGMELVEDQISALTAKNNGTLGLAAIIGLGVSLWSANSGIKSLFGALNVVYHEHEKRSFIKLTLISFAFTLGTIAFVIIALFTVVAVPIILDFFGLGSSSSALLLSLARWPVMLIVVAAALAIIYRYGPSRTYARWQWVSWGGGAAALLWIVASLLFSFYVANFSNYNKTYGSLGAVIGFMTWIWISSMVVLMGGELNAELEQQTERDSTVGPEKPPGERGAFKADVKV